MQRMLCITLSVLILVSQGFFVDLNRRAERRRAALTVSGPRL